MESVKFLSVLSLAFLLSAGSAYAQATDENGGDEGELTITLIPDPEADLPEAVTKQISLPLPNASDADNENSADGRAIADGRLVRRQDSLDTATDARNRGSEFGADMAADAQLNRENFSRGDALDLPGLVPDIPVVPDIPNAPTPPTPPRP